MVKPRTNLADAGSTLMTGSPLSARIWASSVKPLTGSTEFSVTVESSPATVSCCGKRLNDVLNSCTAPSVTSHAKERSRHAGRIAQSCPHQTRGASWMLHSIEPHCQGQRT